MMNNLKLFPFFLAALTLSSGELAAESSTQLAEVENQEVTEVVRKFFPKESKGGLALLVTRDSKIIHCKGYGNINEEKPVTPASKMPLASVTKQFAAMCAAILIEEGRLQMTDKVADYLPTLKFQSPGRELLIQDLIWHTSGLPNFIKQKERESITAYKEARDFKTLNNLTHAEWLATLPLVREPGTEYEYTNSGYVLLCRIMEVITEKPFHEFQQERIFDPLEMHNTSDSKRLNGSGNMMTTLQDYAKWDRALWNHSLLNEETSKLYFSSGELDNGEKVNYAMGWRLEFKNGVLIKVHHDGVGSSPRSARNRISRNLNNRTTIALFVRENTSFDKARRAKFTKAIEACLTRLPMQQ